MATVTVRRMCPDCGQHRPFDKAGVNHVLHLILTLFTVGLWIVPWLLFVVLNAFKPLRCRECGKAKF